jgi:hypothetical protein
MTEKKASAAADGGAQQVQDKVDAETDQGFRGTKVDPRPNEDYTVAGSQRRAGENLGTAGEPAPIEPAITAEESYGEKGSK